MATNNAINCNLTPNTAGSINYPLQPAFLVLVGTSLTNQTGDGTVATVSYNTVIYDQQSNFSGGTTFTAPVTGIYEFNVSIRPNLSSSSDTFQSAVLVTTKRSIIFNYENAYNIRERVSNSSIAVGSVVVNMSAGDTATTTIQVTGGPKTVGILSNNTYWSGKLIC